MLTLNYLIHYSLLGYADSDNKGTTFLLMFMDIDGGDDDPEVYITTLSDDPVSVTVSTPLNNYERDLTVSSDQPNLDALTNGVRLVGTGKANKGILITADEPISVWGINKEAGATDGFLVLDIGVLGTEYYAVMYAPGEYEAQLGMVAVESGTVVDIVVPPGSEILAEIGGEEVNLDGVVLTVELDRLEAFQLQSRQDLTGTHIYSNQPIAAFSGNKRVEIEGEATTPDHIVSQLVPVRSWGRACAIVPFPNRESEDIIRILASETDTEVSIYRNEEDGPIQITLQPREHYAYGASSDSLGWIESNNPIQVVQFGKSHFAAGEVGDATMVVVPSVDQYSRKYRFSVPDTFQGDSYDDNFALIVVERFKRNGLFLDGEQITDIIDDWVDVPLSNPELVAGSVNVGIGTHYISHEEEEVKFEVLLYGYNDDEAYSMPAGMELLELSLKVGCRMLSPVTKYSVSVSKLEK